MNEYFIRLREAQLAKDSLLCAGLDIDSDKIPPCFSREAAFRKFGIAYIKAVTPYAVALIVSPASYEAEGRTEELFEFVRLAHENGLLVIVVGKCDDIDNSSEKYARYIFEQLGADAATVSPYMGYDSVEPFLRYQNKGVYVLCRTSNPDAEEFQDAQRVRSTPPYGTVPQYQYVAERITKRWNKNGNCGLVVGATVPEELEMVLDVSDHLPVLITGVGAQGGSAEKIVPLLGRAPALVTQSRSLMLPKDVELVDYRAEYRSIVGKSCESSVAEINMYRKPQGENK